MGGHLRKVGECQDSGRGPCRITLLQPCRPTTACPSTSTGVKRSFHEAVGEMRLNWQTLHLPDSNGQTLLIYSADTGSPSEEKLRLLASSTADPVTTPSRTPTAGCHLPPRSIRAAITAGRRMTAFRKPVRTTGRRARVCIHTVLARRIGGEPSTDGA
ncbi:hypothetical protein [Streptomyces sp. NPDC046859]|uniref:MmyB family transcriptional regulator n=1 Tax=Streptomyces sp. NPDC046859 TaxID=3155734 RepID=UPI0033F0C296